MRHAFFGRGGGVSTGIYASLNAGTGSGDDPEAVAENRRRIAAAFSVAPPLLIGAHQVHSPDAVFVDALWTGERPHADALVTTTRGLALSVLTADCAPVLLADATVGVIGAAHAGWKGALGGVLENCVSLMREHGARDIEAAIGPCIHQRSYEVGAEFVARFVHADPKYARFFAAGANEKSHFDLPGFCAMRLSNLNVAVETPLLDTYAAAEQLFSYRRSAHAGDEMFARNCSVIAL
ncbi:MAG: peptidoglycan editing factor PgeF [Terricaulis sp.]